jgi:hypothetical protein
VTSLTRELGALQPVGEFARTMSHGLARSLGHELVEVAPDRLGLLAAAA